MFDWIGSAFSTVGGWIGSAASTAGDWIGSAYGTVTSIIGKAGSEIGTAIGAAIGGPAGAGIGRSLGQAFENLCNKEEQAAARGETLSPAQIRAEVERELPISFSPTEAQAVIAAIQANPDVPDEYKPIIFSVIQERTIIPRTPGERKPGGCAAREAFGG